MDSQIQDQSQKASQAAVQLLDKTYKYTCRHCSAKFEKVWALSVHCRTTHPHLYTIDTNCQAGKSGDGEPQTVPAEKKIKAHPTKCKGKTSVHWCMYCGTRHLSLVDLLNHCITVHPKLFNEDKNEDKVKGKPSYTLPSKLRVKAIPKDKVKANGHSCVYCSSVLPTYVDLSEHYKIVHPHLYSLDNTPKAPSVKTKSSAITGQQCLATEHKFKNNRELLEHYAKCHPGCLPQFRCEICQAIYPTHLQLRMHRFERHCKTIACHSNSARLNSTVAYKASLDRNQPPSSTPPLPLCIVSCPVEMCSDKQTNLVADIHSRKEYNHAVSVTSDFDPTEKSGENKANVIEIQPIPDFSHSFSELADGSLHSCEMGMVDNLPYKEDTNSYQLKDDHYREEIKYELPVMETQIGDINTQDNAMKHEVKESTISVDRIVVPIQRELSVLETTNSDNIQENHMKCEEKDDEVVENKSVCLTKTETSDGLKIECLSQEYSEENKFPEVKNNKFITNSFLSNSSETKKQELVNLLPDLIPSKDITTSKTVVPLPTYTKQAVGVLGKERARAPTNRGPFKRKHSPGRYGLSSECHITKSPRRDNMVNSSCQFCTMTAHKLSGFKMMYCMTRCNGAMTKCPHKRCASVFTTYSKLKKHYESYHCADKLCGAQEILKTLYLFPCVYCPERQNTHLGREKHYLKEHYLQLEARHWLGTWLGNHLEEVSCFSTDMLVMCLK